MSQFEPYPLEADQRRRELLPIDKAGCQPRPFQGDIASPYAIIAGKLHVAPGERPAEEPMRIPIRPPGAVAHGGS